MADDDRVAEELRGFGPLGILSALVILALSFMAGIPVLVWARLSHTPWRDLGFVRPRSWTATLAAAIVGGIALKLLMKTIVMPLFGADPVNHTYHFIAGNPSSLPGIIFTMIVVAGFGEETVFRGFLFERLGKLLGRGIGARVTIVLLTSALFALGHYADQGLAGAEQASITGIVFGTIFSLTGSLWLPMIAHAAYDLAAVAMIYWNLESYFAHLVFK